MPQAAARNQFLDILLDPMAIAIVASIALHASLGAGLPFLVQPNKDGKKAGTDAVKVVELTPNEVQRIPQVKPSPVPTPQATTPAQTPAPAPTTAPQPPQTPKFSTAPITIPFSPIRSPQSSPNPAPQPPNPGKKDQRPIAQKQPPQPVFDPNITFTPSPSPTPTPTPTKSPAPKGTATKPVAPKGSTPKPTSAPTTQPSPANSEPKAKKPQATTSTAPPADAATDSDGEGTAPQPKPAPGKPRTQGQKTAGGSPAGTPGSATTQGNNPETGEPKGNETGFYGKYTQAANAKLQEYLRKYPNIKQYPPKKISQQYPFGVPCSNVKQPPFIVLMVVFDKVPEGQDSNILGNTTSPLMENERPYVDGDPATLANKKLIEMATTAGFVDATAADKQRPAIDRGKPVLYSYRVQFDPASCK